MRMYGFLKTPLPAGKRDLVYKVMLHETRRGGTFAYLYTQPDALFCSFDQHYGALEEALEDWSGALDQRGWIPADDPLPDCQDDCLLPIRVKGRASGRPQWGSYEILQDGEWKDFTP